MEGDRGRGRNRGEEKEGKREKERERARGQGEERPQNKSTETNINREGGDWGRQGRGKRKRGEGKGHLVRQWPPYFLPPHSERRVDRTTFQTTHLRRSNASRKNQTPLGFRFLFESMSLFGLHAICRASHKVGRHIEELDRKVKTLPLVYHIFLPLRTDLRNRATPPASSQEYHTAVLPITIFQPKKICPT